MAETPVEIAPNVFWLGSLDKPQTLRCNPYLIRDGKEAVLIEPGSVLDFEEVSHNLSLLVPIEEVSYIVLGHQDPDLVSSVPLFEKAGFKGKIACHWRASVLIKYYGVVSEFYRVDEYDYSLVLDSGRVLTFLPTPYLHFPGAVATYDEKTRILFSSDLFGAFSSGWELYADKGRYLEAMKAFHEHYMPSNEILRPVMENLLKLDISMIAPQHGAIIRSDIAEYILALRDLQCGSFLKPVRKDLSEAGGYTGLCDVVLHRLHGIFPEERILGLFEGSGIVLAQAPLCVTDFDCTGTELWDRFFELLLARGGKEWLTMAEVLVEELCGEYGVPLPSVYKAQAARARREIERLEAKTEELRRSRARLESRLHETEESLIRDAATGLFNEAFFDRFLLSEIKALEPGGEGCNLVVLGVDRLGEFVTRYGDTAGDEALKSMAYFLRERLAESWTLFKLAGGDFAIFVPFAGTGAGATEIAAIEAEAESIRVAVASSRLFLEPLTLSIGVARAADLPKAHGADPAQMKKALVSAAKSCLFAARQAGMNRVVTYAQGSGRPGPSLLVAVADTDETNRMVIGSAFENAGYRVALVGDGEALLDLIEADRPDAVISELMLPKLDAFAVRERTAASSELAALPFIIVSLKRDEESILRAQSLGIEHYLKKPYFLSELFGLVRLSVEKAGRQP